METERICFFFSSFDQIVFADFCLTFVSLSNVNLLDFNTVQCRSIFRR